MSARKIRADYEQLQNIARQFAASAEQCEKAVKKIEKAKNVLQGGDWVGKGATKFYNELDGSVLPSLTRMTVALQLAAQHTEKMSRLISETERTSAALFQIGATSGGGPMLGFALDAKTAGDVGENMGGRLNAKGVWVLPEITIFGPARPGQPSDTTEDAAYSAVWNINKKSIKENVEYAGWVYQDPKTGKFYYTKPRTQGSDRESDPGPFPKGMVKVGSYHTHAGGFNPTDEFFSPQDKLKATLSKTQSFVGTPQGKVLKYTPVNLLPPEQQADNPTGIVEVIYDPKPSGVQD